MVYSLLDLWPQEQCVAHRGHSVNTCCCRASASPEQPHQNGCFGTHIPLLRWPQAELPNGHHLGHHHHHLYDFTGHLHHHPARHSGQDGEKQNQPWRPQPQRDLGLEVRGPDFLITIRFRKEILVPRKRHPPSQQRAPCSLIQQIITEYLLWARHFDLW